MTLELSFDNTFSYFTAKRIDLQLWKAAGVAPSTAGYTEAFEACVAKADWQQAQRLRTRMHEVGIPHDLRSYHALLRVCEAAHLSMECLQLFDEMRSRGMKP